MVNILFFIDFEPGHVYPTLKLAKSLKDDGYNVCYAGPIDDASKLLVENYGFSYYQIFEEVYPKGSSEESDFNLHYNSLLSGKLDNLMEDLNPELILLSSFMCLEGLILYYKYDIKLITYCSFYLVPLEFKDSTVEEELAKLCMDRFMKLSGNEPQRILKLAKEKNKSLVNFNDLIAPLRIMPRLILCPKELKIDALPEYKNEIYLGAGIVESNLSNDFVISDFLPEKKKLIFVSMGSQVKRYPEKAKEVFKKAIGFMKLPQFAGFHMFLSVGGTNVDDWDFGILDNNISVFSWLPQKEVLKEASIAITHGGLGTIKECIYFGTAMLVIPMGRDQIDNAQRVIHHKLGLTVDIEELNSDKISEKVLQLTSDQSILVKVAQMKKIFIEQNDNRQGVDFVKNFINAS